MFLIDWTIVVSGKTPFAHDINFADDLNDVFAKEGGSLQVASHVLQDERLFQALREETHLANDLTITR